MFILTDGKNYVMRNPISTDKYLSTTSPVQAEKFTYKQARALLRNKRASMKWIKEYRIVDVDSGNEVKNVATNDGVFCGNKDVRIDDKILNDIIYEADTLLGIAGWNSVQLSTYKNLLSGALSKCDSAESDIEHALEWYEDNYNGRKPQAHKVAKLGYLLSDIRSQHKKIKQCIAYIDVMQSAITYKYDLEKIKQELSKVRYVEYKGRTEYYNMALEILK